MEFINAVRDLANNFKELNFLPPILFVHKNEGMKLMTELAQMELKQGKDFGLGYHKTKWMKVEIHGVTIIWREFE